jgi:membrane protein
VYGVLVGGAWLVLARLLPRGDVGWMALVPGAAVVGVGLLFVNSFNVYLTTRLVDERADTYGALGIAAALLFSLYLVGRLIVGSAVLNATLDARGRR